MSREPTDDDIGDGGEAEETGKERGEQRLSKWIFFGCIVAVCGVLGAGATILPMGGDQGNYAYAAWVWSEGAVPYRDVLVWRPPVTLFVYRVAHELFGHSMVGIRVVDLVWQLATCGVVAGIAMRLTGERSTAAFAGIGYALIYFQFDFWHSAQTDGWLALPMALAIALTLRATSREAPSAAFLAGCAVGVGAFLKYPALSVLLPVAFVLFARERWQSPAYVGSLVGGFVVVTAAVVGWLVGSGAWGAFVHHHTEVLPRYVEFSSSGRGLSGFVQFAYYLAFAPMLDLLFGATLLGGLGWIVWGGRRLYGDDGADEEAETTFTRGLIGAWFVAAFATTFAQGKFFEYHYLPMAAPVAVMGAVAFRQLTRSLPRWVPAVLFAGLTGWVALGPHNPGAPSLKDWWRVASGQEAFAEYWMSEEFQRPKFSMADNLVLGQWMVRHTDPDDRVFIWGRVPLVNYWARRKSATRYIYNYPFRYPWSAESRDRDLMEGLRRTTPAYFVIASGDSVYRASGSERDSREVLRDFEALREWMEMNYRPSETIGRFEIWRRQ